MAFCKYCGRQLDDGTICDCQNFQALASPTDTLEEAPEQPAGAPSAVPLETPEQPAAYASPEPYVQPVTQNPYVQQPYGSQPSYGAQQPYGAQPSYAPPTSAAPSAFSIAFKEVYTSFIRFFANPIQCAKDIRDNDSMLKSLIFIGIQALLTGLFVFITLLSIPAILVQGSTFLFALPYFLYGILFSLAFSFALAACYLLFSKAFKITISFQKSLAIVAAASIPGTVIIIPAFILGLIGIPALSIALSFAISAGASVASISISYSLIKEYAKERESSALWTIITSHTATSFVIYLILFIIITAAINSMLAGLLGGFNRFF